MLFILAVLYNIVPNLLDGNLHAVQETISKDKGSGDLNLESAQLIRHNFVNIVKSSDYVKILDNSSQGM